ncbi:MAG: esterase, partial [Kiritimatiellae bacterium]|nr:esterase [Kiritimatiellia bacterium]
MYREEITHYAHALERDMHIMIHGHGGMPLLCFPTQDSMCRNYEDFGVVEHLSDYISGGRVQ